LKLVLFESLNVVSYWPSIVTMAVFCISEIKQDVGQKSRFFRNPLHSTLPSRGLWNIAIPFGSEKLVWLPDGENMFDRFDRIPVCDRQTDGHLATV